MIADDDVSQPYELDAAAVFKARDGYLVVFVSGCSCWPDRGATEQVVCPNKTAVDRALRANNHYRGGAWRDLLQKCQDAGWKVSELARTS